MSRRRSAAHEAFAHQILSEIEAGRPISQRSLASSLGIALGLTNLLLRRLIRRGWVRVSRIRANRVAYFLTPSGMAEKARMSRAFLQDSVRFYASARNRIRARFDELSRQWPGSDTALSRKRIVFLGAGEVAEIGYVCLPETDLTLVGVIDFDGRARFFDVPVYPAADVNRTLLDQIACDHVVVMAFTDSKQVRGCVERLELPPERISWI